jgi:hypothetical protein
MGGNFAWSCRVENRTHPGQETRKIRIQAFSLDGDGYFVAQSIEGGLIAKNPDSHARVSLNVLFRSYGNPRRMNFGPRGVVKTIFQIMKVLAYSAFAALESAD